MIESIEKLRESSHLDDSKWTLETGEVIHVYGSEPNDPNAVNWGEQWRKIADEIEREIAERYIELPCDADGVPIHVGDTIEYPNGRRDVVRFITVNDNMPTFNERGWVASKCRHVEPRTIEDVLRDLVDGIGSVEFDALTAIGEAADEIRELMEVE